MEKTILKQKREAAGLSQSQLADLSGVNFRLLQDYEQGRKSLNHAKAEMLYRLSYVLDCDMKDLLTVETIPFEHAMDDEMVQRMLIYKMNLTDETVHGSVDIIIDEIVPCLKNTLTGKEEDTVVFKIESRSFLKQFQKKNGWHIEWIRLNKEIEVYALALKRTNEIQGLVALRNDAYSKAAFIHWACTAPHNNLHEFGSQKYTGVGGHLFAIAAQKSLDWGYDGVMHGFAANHELLEHYIEKFGATYLGMMHQYQFFVDEVHSRQLREVYTYEWNERK